NSSEYMTYNGKDTAEKIRNCIRDYYFNFGIKWVLLAGDTKDDNEHELIPIRYVKNPDSSILPGFSEAHGSDNNYKPTDFYYAELTGNWDLNGNGIYGESLRYTSVDEIDWNTEVYVGRFPGSNSEELSIMVNKTISYENATEIGNSNWRNRILLGSAVQGWISDEDSDGEEEYFLTQKIIEESIIPENMSYIHLQKTISQGSNLTLTAFDKYAEQGNTVVFFAGHGNPTRFVGTNSGSSEIYFERNCASGLTNYEMPSLFYADACSTNYFDYLGGDSGDCIGEILIKKPRGGAIGYIGSMRISWFYQNDTYDWGELGNLSLCEMNRGMARLFFSELLQKGNTQQGKALYEMKRSYLNSQWLKENPSTWKDERNKEDAEDDIVYEYNIHNIEWERKNVLSYTLLGDPETDIYTNNPIRFSGAIFNGSNTYTEGQEIKIEILDVDNSIVQNARLCITGDDGTYGYFDSNDDGMIELRLPEGEQTYNYTISAHNMKFFHGTFTTKHDENPPDFKSGLLLYPTQPTADINIIAKINASDTESAVSCGYLVTSKNNFKTFEIHRLEHYGDFSQLNCFRGVLPKLGTGVYSYIIFIIDYGGNLKYTAWNNKQIFMIPVPILTIFVVSINVILLISIGWYIFKRKSIISEYSNRISDRISEKP
ncbi:MAG: C25 family cysteine peptidase, partial [Promethearchaeota archaeon]